jgi:hypothetical protein
MWSGSLLHCTGSLRTCRRKKSWRINARLWRRKSRRRSVSLDRGPKTGAAAY